VCDRPLPYRAVRLALRTHLVHTTAPHAHAEYRCDLNSSCRLNHQVGTPGFHFRQSSVVHVTDSQKVEPAATPAHRHSKGEEAHEATMTAALRRTGNLASARAHRGRVRPKPNHRNRDGLSPKSTRRSNSQPIISVRNRCTKNFG
jgi:hypothetical protein